MLGQVLLVIFLGPVKGRRGFDLGYDRAVKTAALFQLRALGFGGRFLRRRMIKDNRSILRTDVRSLAVARRRVMVAPENVEQLLIGNFRRIESHFDDFGVASLVAANVF